MSQSPFISICIPAYKRAQYLKRLLDSIVIQEYKDFEVIVTDDSPDEKVTALCSNYNSLIKIVYVKNTVPLGTPKNWNKAITKACGKWIKLMHDDDWFTDGLSLAKFAAAAQNAEAAFIFSAYCNVFEGSKKEQLVTPEKFRLTLLEKAPYILMAKNFIGPPSVVMHKNDEAFEYDSQLKWLVDIDMYVRRIAANQVVFIDEPLIKVGISQSQVTAAVKNVGAIEIPEHFHFLNKMGVDKLNNILVYDYFWRFIRNFNIRNLTDFEKFGYRGEVPQILKQMVNTQQKIPTTILKNGILSKFIMSIHFLINKKHIPH